MTHTIQKAFVVVGPKHRKVVHIVQYIDNTFGVLTNVFKFDFNRVGAMFAETVRQQTAIFGECYAVYWNATILT